MSSRALSAVSPILILTASAAAQTASFAILGDLPGGNIHSEAFAVSGDGTTVVGYSLVGTNQGHAFKYVGNALIDIGDLAGGTVAGVALGVNRDGTVIGGQGNSANGNEACRWVNSNSPSSLGGTVPGGFFGAAVNAVNANGSVMVGTHEFALFDSRACKWVNGTLTSLGAQANGTIFSAAYGVSADGTKIAGACDTSNGGHFACVLRGSTFTVLPDLATGANTGEANDVSDDGTVVVGWGNIEITPTLSLSHACRWVNSVPQDLGDLPGGRSFSVATACSADGGTVVGYSDSAAAREAFIWTQGGGMRALREVLTERGVTGLNVFILREARGISDDGTVICGIGTSLDGYTLGWVANLNVVPPCPADFNQDGGVDGSDVAAFFQAWEGGDASSDVNQDGGIDGGDVEYFFVRWSAGGCN
ncbi:MAG: hypothetical protein JSR77_05115 [Planctomycetes bacterium]|nr:hypothetical protein [Planctomycetota bacterium]